MQPRVTIQLAGDLLNVARQMPIYIFASLPACLSAHLVGWVHTYRNVQLDNPVFLLLPPSRRCRDSA